MTERIVVLLLALFHVALAIAQERVEVITLDYRTAEQVIPIVQPLVGPDGAVTGMQNKLIVRASPERLAQIKQVIASIDSRPRRLMITVRQNTTREALAREAGVYGTAGGEHARVTVPEQPGRAGARVEVGSGDDRVSAKVWASAGQATSADEQQLQVLEGNAAFIQVGQSVPYRGRTVYRDARGASVVEDHTSYRDVTSGFYVLPRVVGEQVILEINPQQNTLGPRGTVNVQQAATTVSGRLGEWIELGGVGQQAEAQGSGTVYSTRRLSSDTRSIFVKVEELR
jgi:hypothetical protein